MDNWKFVASKVSQIFKKSGPICLIMVRSPSIFIFKLRALVIIVRGRHEGASACPVASTVRLRGAPAGAQGGAGAGTRTALTGAD